MEISNCLVCKNEFQKKTTSQEYCSKECKKFKGPEKLKRKMELNIKLVQEQSARAKTEWKQTDIIKKSIISDMISTKGYPYCEECGWTRGGLDLHHIATRAEVPKHPQKHSKINSLLLCNELTPNKCHLNFHRNKYLRNKWIIKRRLWEIFNIFKKENYV